MYQLFLVLLFFSQNTVISKTREIISQLFLDASSWFSQTKWSKDPQTYIHSQKLIILAQKIHSGGGTKNLNKILHENKPGHCIYWHDFIFKNFSLNSKPENFSIFSAVFARTGIETVRSFYRGFLSKFAGTIASEVQSHAEVPKTVQFHVCYRSARRRNLLINSIDFWAHNTCVKFC